MNLPDFPFTTTDWARVPATLHSGDTGGATWRTLEVGDVRVRMVDDSPGYRADHSGRSMHVQVAHHD